MLRRSVVSAVQGSMVPRAPSVLLAGLAEQVRRDVVLVEHLGHQVAGLAEAVAVPANIISGFTASAFSSVG